MKGSIQIEGLNIGYLAAKKEKHVAGNLNATLQKGEMTCLLGPNGTGKSTLMKTISGFINALSGMVRINGKDIKLLDEKEMAKLVAIVLTEKISVPNATVYELVAYGRSPFTGFLGRLAPKDREAVDKAISMCRISHKKNSLISNLSDGERQKATIAKALAQDTPIILLDEPTAFLDLPSRVEIMQLLRKLASEMHKAVLMSTHDLDLALQMSDKLWLLQKDRLISGSPEDLLLQNAFQTMFIREDIEFDNKTGLFKVAYQYQQTFPVQGHGFEYVLLRRALLRKGIKPVKAIGDDETFISVQNGNSAHFEIWKENKLWLKTSKVEQAVNHISKLIDSYAVQKINKFLKPDYPQGRAKEVLRPVYFDLKVQKPKFDYYTSPKTVKNSFDLSLRRGEIGNPEAKPRGILLIKRGIETMNIPGKIKVATVSSWSEPLSVEQNIRNITGHLNKLESRGVEYALFPELSISGYINNSGALTVYARMHDRILSSLKSLSAKHQITFSVGLPLPFRDGFGIAQLTFNRGAIVHVHIKTHLSVHEKKHFIPGDKLELFSTKGYNMGMQICLESHYPELSLAYQQTGADMLCFAFASPRETPEEKLQRIKTMLLARAYDNVCFVMACNQTGKTQSGKDFAGITTIVSPRGKVIDEHYGFNPSICIAELDFNEIKTIKNSTMSNFPAYRNTKIQIDINPDNPGIY